jgi:hypothetical protein
MAERYYRKIIRIRAEDSPNVRYALTLKERGIEPPENKIIVPGVLPYADYVKRRATWDPVRQCIGLDALFYEGAEVLMYPPMWLNAAERYADELSKIPRKGEAMGVDTAEGTDDTSWTVVDKYGITEQVSIKTPDTDKIMGQTIALMQKWGVKAISVCFDRGGGGKQVADRMRAAGYPVQTIAFGEPINPPLKRGKTQFSERQDNKEEKYSYFNKRAEMYGKFRERLNPADNGGVTFGIPTIYTELRRQLSLMPLLYDEEGRIKLPPKNKKNPKSQEKTIREILGCSPDQADSLILAYQALMNKPRIRVGVAF